MSMAVLDEPHVWATHHRCYDPTTAQFTTPDPLFAMTGSRYGYAANDPVNGSDPTGMCGPFGDGPCNPVSIAKEVVNTGVRAGTFGQANCIRGATCARSTPSAFVSDQQAADFAGGVLNGATGGLTSDLAPSLYDKANLHSGWGWAGQGVGVGASLVAAAGDVWVGRGLAGLSTLGTCLSGAPVGYCIAAGALNGARVGVGRLPWGDLGAPSAEGMSIVIGDYLGIWPGVIGDLDRSGCGG